LIDEKFQREEWEFLLFKVGIWGGFGSDVIGDWRSFSGNVTGFAQKTSQITTSVQTTQALFPSRITQHHCRTHPIPGPASSSSDIDK
jgi:hypothetical protein